MLRLTVKETGELLQYYKGNSAIAVWALALKEIEERFQLHCKEIKIIPDSNQVIFKTGPLGEIVLQ